jgi:hypothetical protein
MSDPMTAEEAMVEVAEVNERLADLHEILQHAKNTGSDAVPQLQHQISEAAARKEWLFGQIHRMRKAGS